MSVVEVGFIAISEHDEKRSAERFDVRLDGQEAVVSDVHQRKLDRTARSWQRPSVLDESQQLDAVGAFDLPIGCHRNRPLVSEDGEVIGSASRNGSDHQNSEKLENARRGAVPLDRGRRPRRPPFRV